MICIRARLEPCRRIERTVWASAPGGRRKASEAKAFNYRCVAARLPVCPDTEPAARFPLPCRRFAVRGSLGRALSCGARGFGARGAFAGCRQLPGVPFGPQAPPQYRFFERPAARREPIFHARRHLGKNLAVDHADFFEPLQGERKLALRYAPDGTPQNGEPQRPRRAEQVVEHRHGPFGSDHADQPRHGAIARGAGRRPSFGWRWHTRYGIHPYLQIIAWYG